jgi:exodeoxyribonuclease VII large subunit
MEHLSLVELSSLIQETIKKNLEPSYWVVAEISDISVNQKGHCYLELIQNEEDKLIAKSRATIWSYTYRNLSTWFQGITGQPLAEGMKILANVKINFHELYGYSLNIQDIDANYTLGEKERSKIETINRLVADGVFDMNRELELPLVPQKIAVISSPTAAGYGDYIHQLDYNSYGYKISNKLFPAVVQGSEAPESIIAALHQILSQGDFDLVVLIRGGGSQVDLECFNNYDLCSHIAQFPTPIITGIGHERDDTIADMVANTKQKTPTAAAEFILQGFIAYETTVNDLLQLISKNANAHLQSANLELQYISGKIGLLSKGKVSSMEQYLNRIIDRIVHSTKNQASEHVHNLNAIETKINDLDPRNTLDRGYTFTMFNDSSIFEKKVSQSDLITTYSSKQIIESTVLKTRKNDKI